MATYLVVNRFEDLNIENFKIGLPRNQKYSIVRYIDPKDKSRKQLYLQTPGVHLGNLSLPPMTSEDVSTKQSKPVLSSNNSSDAGTKSAEGQKPDTTVAEPNQIPKTEEGVHAYLDLYLHREKDEFRKTLNEIDMHIIKRIWAHRVEWGLNKDTSLIEIERCWIPSLKISSLDYEQNCLKFSLPMKLYAGKHYLEMDIYDQENYELPIPLLKPEYPARCLIFYKGVIKDGNYFYLDWDLKQLKVKIPDQVFDACQLSDGEEPANQTWIDSDEEIEPIYE